MASIGARCRSPGAIRDERRIGVSARWAFRRVQERPDTRSVAPGFRVVPRWGGLSR